MALTQQDISQIAQLFNDGFTQIVNTRIESLEKKFDALEEKVDDNTSAIITLTSNVTALDRKVNALDDKVNALDDKVNALDKKIDERTSDLLDHIKENTSNFGFYFQSLHSRISRLEKAA